MVKWTKAQEKAIGKLKARLLTAHNLDISRCRDQWYARGKRDGAEEVRHLLRSTLGIEQDLIREED